jgi:hypothetical protein
MVSLSLSKAMRWLLAPILRQAQYDSAITLNIKPLLKKERLYISVLICVICGKDLAVEFRLPRFARNDKK